MDNMDNPNQGDNERLIFGTRMNMDEEKQRDEKDRFTDDNPLPENRQNRSEADKEADTRPEDFESFNVDKVDDLQQSKNRSNKTK